MSAALKLDQFAVQDAPARDAYPAAPKGLRFIAAMLDGFFYSGASAMIQALILKTVGGGLLTIAAIALVFPIVYFVFPLYATGQTLGKRVMKLQVVRADGVADLSFMQAANREMFYKAISLLVFGLGFIRILTHAEGRAWHDSMSSTKVIHLKDE